MSCNALLKHPARRASRGNGPQRPCSNIRDRKPIVKIALMMALIHLASPAYGLTAQELVQADRKFATGYIFGAIEYQIGVAIGKTLDPSQQKFRNCLIDKKIMSETLYQAVTNFIRNNPESRSRAAVAAIVQTEKEICPEAGN
jgi:hypothetical protein